MKLAMIGDGQRMPLRWSLDAASGIVLCLALVSVSCGPPKAPAEGGESAEEGGETQGPDVSPGGDTSGGGGGGGVEPGLEAPPRRELIMRTKGAAFELEVDGQWRPFFMNGVNMGMARPGTDPGELPQDREAIRRWLELCGELGVNSIRLYTLQMPEFYQEFLLYQKRHPDRPLWLVHGIWLDEAPGDDYLVQTEVFTQDIRYTIDAVHGNADIDVRFGKAFGQYRVDVSSYVISWLVGRELEPYVVYDTNEKHKGYSAFSGEYFSIEGGSAMETWITEMLEYVAAYGHGKYGTLRPQSFSSWPTLDPLTHPVQPKDMLESAEDFVDIDLTKVKLGPKNPAGLYASYHAYPYYPEFILYTPAYEAFSDASGMNTYLGYLTDMRAKYSNMPLVIAEYGVPSSRGVGKYASSGMHQGGHGEVEQGLYNARLLDNIAATDCAGAILFAFMDEWFKTAWIVELMELPTDRRRTWKNVHNPEQNFGLIAMDAQGPGTRVIDADGDDWTGQPVAQKNDGVLRKFYVSHDAAYVYLRLDVDPAALDFSQHSFYVGIDTVSRQAGDSRYPDGISTPAGHGLEFVARLDGFDTAELLVDTPYDTYAWWFWELTQDQRLRSVPNDDGQYNSMFYLVNYEFYYDGDLLAPRRDQWVGKLEHGDDSPESALSAALTDWTHNANQGFIELRLPWGLLNFTDPSRAEVLFDDRDTGPTEVRKSEGLAFSVVATKKSVGGVAPAVVDRLPASGHTTPYIWETWEFPTYKERKKASFRIFKDGIAKTLGPNSPWAGTPSYLPPP